MPCANIYFFIQDNLSAEEKEYAAAVLEEALSESSVTMQDFCEGNVPKCSISTKVGCQDLPFQLNLNLIDSVICPLTSYC